MVTGEENVFFQLGILYLVVFNKNIFANSFDSIHLLHFLEFGQINLAERTTAQEKLKFKVLECQEVGILLTRTD